mmetsp:Transcript_17347/g.47277  ORF Transcript_17347/g.47277 Transcript_17347/m.47277 type:complete len:264 (-) Transcript_17347:50-841(-)
MRGDVLEAKREGHPRGGGPIPRVTREVGTSPFFVPRARADCKAKVDERKSRVCTRHVAIGKVHQHVVRAHVPVIRDRFQGRKYAGELRQQAPHDNGRVDEVPRTLLTTRQVAINKLHDFHSFVLLVTDAIQPLVESTPRAKGHRQVYCAAPAVRRSAARFPAGAVRNVPWHMLPAFAVERHGQDLQQLGLKGRSGKGGCVLRNDYLDGGFLAITLLRAPNDAKSSAAHDFLQFKMLVADFRFRHRGLWRRRLLMLLLLLRLLI